MLKASLTQSEQRMDEGMSNEDWPFAICEAELNISFRLIELRAFSTSVSKSVIQKVSFVVLEGESAIHSKPPM